MPRLPIFLFVAIGLLAVCAAAQESVYNGAFGGGTGSLNNAIQFETDSGKGLSIINFFRNWDDSNGVLHFPTSAMDGIRAHGSIPMISWQPEGASPDATYSLDNIVVGNFDDFLLDWALDAKAWGQPFFLRFAHEMNGNWYPWCAGVNGNTAADYIAAWRHIHDLFVRNGVTNVTWVWCVNTKYSGSTPVALLYPGDNYVDWIALDCYNRITNAWADFSVRAQPTLDELLVVAPGKPIMVAEAGCHEDPVEDKGQWFKTAMKNWLKFSAPRIKAWVYFNGNNPDGNDWRITTSPGALAGYQESVALSYYSANSYSAITTSPIQPLTNDATTTDTMAPFVALVTPQSEKVQTGARIEYRVLASDKSGIQKVEYLINGTLEHTENLAPYQYFWTVPATAGASYTVVAKAYDNTGLTATSTIALVSQNAPGAPTGVAASDGTFTDKVRVTWSSVVGALGYEVWRHTTNNSASAAKLTDIPVAGTTYDDTTAPYTTTYYYWVKSLDASGPSAFSASDSGFRVLPPASSAPTGVYATDGIYNDKVLVGWNSVSTATGYEVWRHTTSNSAAATKLTASPVTGTTYDDTTASYATGYYYWLKAVNDGGSSGFSVAGYGFRGHVPTISDIANQTIEMGNATGPLAFTIDDAETPAASLTLGAASSNVTLVPLAGIAFGGAGASRTVAVTPAANQSGTATITITVTDADAGAASDAFVLTVTNPDADGDGMPDAWESAHGLNPNLNDAALDADSDGASNLAEYQAGTDPRSSASRLRITAVTIPAIGQITVTWPGAAGKNYRLSTSASLATWTPRTPLVSATTTGPQSATLDTGGAPVLFVRVTVVP